MNLGIVAIGYNRPDAMKRLLGALLSCDYGDDEVALILSIDKGETKEVTLIAEEFEWRYGEKIVKIFSERQGLQRHILKCGAYMEEFGLDAIAVFEDDIVPSVDFYNFMKQAVAFYKDEKGIAGIGLYSYLWNPIANKPFSPMLGKGSVYLNQFAVSWGQIWLRAQWNDFVKWYREVNDEKINEIKVPLAVKAWKNSWLKYHIAYCSAEKKYFVYPYKSLTTCYAEQGTHTEVNNNNYQVPIVQESGGKYCFLPINEISVRYDSFFESEYLYKNLMKQGYDTNIDLYGLKGEDEEKKYWLSAEFKPYKKVKSFGLRSKPHEMNVLYNINGDEIYLYDRSGFCTDKKKTEFNINKFIYYFDGSVDKRFLIYQVVRMCKTKFRRIFFG